MCYNSKLCGARLQQELVQDSGSCNHVDATSLLPRVGAIGLQSAECGLNVRHMREFSAGVTGVTVYSCHTRMFTLLPGAVAPAGQSHPPPLIM
jgi:hypothetical protein